MKPLYALAIMSVICMLTSCGSAKRTTSTSQNSEPAVGSVVSNGLEEYGFGRSGDQGKAYRDALRDAQLNIATRLYRALSSVDTEFGQDTAMGSDLQSMSKRSERSVGIIDDKVVTIRNAKEPIFTMESSGIWNCRVEVVVDNSLVKEIAKDVYEGLSDDDALRVKFEEQQFIEEYNKQLEDYRNRNK